MYSYYSFSFKYIHTYENVWEVPISYLLWILKSDYLSMWRIFLFFCIQSREISFVAIFFLDSFLCAPTNYKFSHEIWFLAGLLQLEVMANIFDASNPLILSGPPEPGGARGATGPPKVSESQCIRGYWPPKSFQGPLVVAPSKIFSFRRPWLMKSNQRLETTFQRAAFSSYKNFCQGFAAISKQTKSKACVQRDWFS